MRNSGAAAIFLIVRAVNRIRRRQSATEEKPEEVLIEIRDILKANHMIL